MINLKNKMIISIEQFTAPGKYAVDEFFERIEAMINVSKNIYNHKTSKKFKSQNYQLNQPYYNRMQKK